MTVSHVYKNVTASGCSATSLCHANVTPDFNCSTSHCVRLYFLAHVLCVRCRSVIYAIASHQRDPGLQLKKRKTVQFSSDADAGTAPASASAANASSVPSGVGVASPLPGGATNGTSSREESSDDTTDTDGADADADPFSESVTVGDGVGGGDGSATTGTTGATTILAEANSALANVDNWFIDL